MSLLLSRFSKPVSPLRRSSVSLLFSSGFSSQSPPCSVVGANPCGPRYADGGKLIIFNATETNCTFLEKKVPLELVGTNAITVGSSHAWVATVKDDGILRLQDDLNPYATGTYPKRISLPPLVTLPHCQTQIVTSVAMSSSSPEDEDCVVSVKFLGPQLSFCRPAAQSNSSPLWTNIKIPNSCFYSSPVMFSKRDRMFRIPGSGGHLIGSWDLNPSPYPKFQKLRFQNIPKLTKTKRQLLDSCTTTEHLVESQSTGETFLVKWYKKTSSISHGMAKMNTKALMVFKLDDEGNAVYTDDIGDLCMFISKSEPFCVPASSFPGLLSNHVKISDVDEIAVIDLADNSIISETCLVGAPYFIPPQKID